MALTSSLGTQFSLSFKWAVVRVEVMHIRCLAHSLVLRVGGRGSTVSEAQ